MTAPLPERVRDRPLTDAEVEKIATNWERLSFSEKVLLSTLRHDAATIASLRAENARLTSEVERLRAVQRAAMGLLSWDWMRLLPDTPVGDDVRRDADILEAALTALDA